MNGKWPNACVGGLSRPTSAPGSSFSPSPVWPDPSGDCATAAANNKFRKLTLAPQPLRERLQGDTGQNAIAMRPSDTENAGRNIVASPASSGGEPKQLAPAPQGRPVELHCRPRRRLIGRAPSCPGTGKDICGTMGILEGVNGN